MLSNNFLKNRYKYFGGFSLLEVLITSAIIGIITAIVIVKYGSFNSSVLLKNHAYEVALSIREAQVFSVSIRSDSNDFRYHYGAHVDLSSGPSSNLIIFADADLDGVYTPPAVPPNPGDDILVEDLVLDSRFEISDICVTIGAALPDCDATKLSITFGRPNFDAKFAASGVGAGTVNKATITISPVSNSSIERVITVSSTGQISVQ